MENGKRKFNIGDYVRNIKTGEMGFIAVEYCIRKNKGGAAFWIESEIEKNEKSKYEQEVEILSFIFDGKTSIKTGVDQLMELGINKKEAKKLALESHKSGIVRRKKS